MEETKSKKNTSTKEPKPAAKKAIFVDIAKFIYNGEEDYYHKDEKGQTYVFKTGDTIFLHDGERARWFDYKSQLFERLTHEK